MKFSPFRSPIRLVFAG